MYIQTDTRNYFVMVGHVKEEEEGVNDVLLLHYYFFMTMMCFCCCCYPANDLDTSRHLLYCH